MKRKQIIAPTSANVNRVSNTVDLGDLKDLSIQVIFSGVDVDGSLKLQATNDESDATSWVDVDGSTQAVTSSQNHMWNLAVANYLYVRVDWTYTSGTGNISAIAVIKENPITGA